MKRSYKVIIAIGAVICVCIVGLFLSRKPMPPSIEQEHDVPQMEPDNVVLSPSLPTPIPEVDPTIKYVATPLPVLKVNPVLAQKALAETEGMFLAHAGTRTESYSNPNSPENRAVLNQMIAKGIRRQAEEESK
ncbi:hypothetical protein [Nibricoccus sp. IMCC34717]|uniref:hypothetical protein n=1 Tax=Nibricoccus sp. IMCC34717 TaxID=3034021 RepID=UPI00384B8A4E